MKKQYLFNHFVLLFLFFSASSCKWLNIENKLFPCQNYVPQSHKFGQYVTNVKANKAILQVGDTIFLSVKMNQQFYDSLTRQPIQVQQKVALFVKVANAVGPVNSSNPFATDTTIYRVFDQYFKTQVVKGVKTTAYDFDCRLQNGFWELELQYIALKKGRYDLAVSFKAIQTGEPALLTGTCMTGDVEVFGARMQLSTSNNQIKRVYPTLSVPSNDLFGFIIE
ncbi:MAG: hypothetical protein EOO61_06345 [Hymenobacter sp.]|nr:MAG: hypothetical protein EOO61_06345 [Hymenobacter sp.]